MRFQPLVHRLAHSLRPPCIFNRNVLAPAAILPFIFILGTQLLHAKRDEGKLRRLYANREGKDTERVIRNLLSRT